MPGRRSRKRRRPAHMSGESFPKRQEFLLHYARLQSLHQPSSVNSRVESQHLAVAGEEDSRGIEAPSGTLYGHLKRALPTQLMRAVLAEGPFISFKNKPVPLSSTTDVLESPSFCIGRLSLSLANGASLKDLLSQVHSMEKDIRPNVMLCPYWPGYLQLMCDYSSCVYLSIASSPPLFSSKYADCQHIKTSGSGPYRVQFVLAEGEREEDGGMSAHPLHSSGVGTSGVLEVHSRDETTVGSMREPETLTQEVENDLQLLGAEGGGVWGVGEGVMGTGEEQTQGEGDGGLSDRGKGCVAVEVWVGGPVCEPCHPSAPPAGGGSAKLARLVNLFHPQVSTSLDTHPSTPTERESQGLGAIELFYRDVKERRREMFGTAEPAFDTRCIPGLTAELRGYQCRAVHWMIDREKGVEPERETRSRQLHPLWREFTGPNGTLYCNPHTGRVTSVSHCPPPPPLGGILADEMGLGKTVELLALVMAHRAPEAITESSRLVREERAREREGPSHPTSETQPLSSGDSADILPDGSQVMDTGDVVECVCGACDDGCDPELVFVQCERCGVWQHSLCAGFNNRLQSSFVCTKCLLKEPLPSRATLIISPQSILQQWKEEVEKHTKPTSLSLMHYEGVKYGSVSPYDLAECDIVLVSYETLALELNYTKSHEEKALQCLSQSSTSCEVVEDPFPCIRHFNAVKQAGKSVCLDEAQMVESVVTKPAEMCLRLQSVYRWCVTGTPVQRNLSDLYGLVLFLGMDLYSEGLWYRRLITEPYLRGCLGPMVDLFSSIMWRNTKEDVAEEIKLPPQTEQIHSLEFSLVERYLYNKQHELCRTESSKVFLRLCDRHSLGSCTLGNLTHDTVQKIMAPLHSLRQVCCHPQMVRSGGYIHVPIGNKKPLTMEKLLDKLIVQAKVEAREGLRKLIFSLNGMAGLNILKEEWSEACRIYQLAIATWEDYKKKEVECDRIQRIHTLENMAWLMEQDHCQESLQRPHDTTDCLKGMAQELRVQFMSKAEGQVKAAAVAVLACKKTIRESYLLLAGCHAEEGAVQSLWGGGQDTNEPMQDSSSSKRDVSRPTQGRSSSIQDTSQSLLDRSSSNQDTSESMRASSSSNQDTSEPMRTSTSSNRDTNQLMRASSSYNRDTSEPVRASSSSNRDTSEPMRASTSGIDKPTDKSLNAETSSIILWRETEETAPELGMMWFKDTEAWVVCGERVTEKMVVKAVNSSLSNTLNGVQLGGQLSLGGQLGGVSVPKFREMSGILFFVCRHIDQLKNARFLSLKLLHSLLAPPSSLEVMTASVCHLSRRDSSHTEREEERQGLLLKCDLCVAESALVQYGTLLFSDYFGSSIGRGHGEGSRGVHAFEKVIHSFLNFLRQKRAPMQLIESGKAFVEYFDAIKREYDALRTLWMRLSQRVCECDELILATSRMRFMTQSEVEVGTGDMSAVHPLHWVVKETEFEMEKSLAATELTRALGQVIYLNNLAETPANSTDCRNCPICTSQLGSEIVKWGMLPCGHPLCMDCLFALSRKHHCGVSGRSEAVRLSCPLCRFSFVSSEVNIVRPTEEEDVEIKGNPSTKILGVVRTLLAIQHDSPTAKTLVFSSWLDVLTLISASLKENGLSHCYLKTSKTFQRNLSEFKTSSTVNILLLPLHSGSKGLNITEATHVILVEPGLNISAELQAIGRVHRMGQDKPTTVHRFMIRDSVEEKIYHLLTSSSNQTKCLTQKEGQSSLTLQDLETLFN